MGGKSPAASFVSGCVLIVANLLAMAVAALVAAVGVWMIASPLTLHAALQRLSSEAVMMVLRREALSAQLGVALLLLGCFVFGVAFLGCGGALADSHFMLFMYGSLVALLLLLECALFYYIGSQLVEKWSGGLAEGEGWGAGAHALRLTFRCCGAHNYTDIASSSAPSAAALPWSCCGAVESCTPDRTYARGCSEAISAWLDRNQTMIYSSLAVLHIILLSCSLIKRATIAPFQSHRP